MRKQHDLHFPMSQARCRKPFNEWNVNGNARTNFPAYFAASGSPVTNSITWAESNVPGAKRYAIENPYKTEAMSNVICRLL